MAKILIVEDDALNRKMFARRLQMVPYEVVTATNGLEAVECARTEQPDLILMDVRLPLLSGIEATKQIKADPSTSHIPIIALTAYVLIDERQRSEAAGVDDYETKPVDFPRLFAKIRALLKS